MTANYGTASKGISGSATMDTLDGDPGQASAAYTNHSARAISEALRARIVAGEWPPGGQVPTRAVLEAEFGASRVTVQRALDELKRHGWVEAAGRRGTFVPHRLPHLTRYALVFPWRPSDRALHPAGQFLRTLEALSLRWTRADGASITPYYEVDGHGDREDYRRLVDEVRGNRVAGIIFATAPHTLLHTPLVLERGLPRVALMTSQPSLGIPALTLSRKSFWDQALDYLAAAGCRKVAIISQPKVQNDEAIGDEALARRGLTTRRFWRLSVSLSSPETAMEVAHLLLQPGQQERPDGLIIADDNLVEHVISGVIAAGVDVPGQLKVVAHANFPQATYCPLPAMRIGFDISRVLMDCISLLDSQRGRTPVLQGIEVEAVLDPHPVGN